MPTRIYKEGGFIILESDVDNKIDVEAFSFSFNGSNTVLIDQKNSRTYEDLTASIQNKLGTPVGDELAVDVYLLALKPASGGGGGSSDTTAANQVLNIDKLEEINSVVTDTKDNTKKKPNGSLLDLTSDDGGSWGGFPLDLIELILTINGASTSYPLNSLSSPTNKDLAQQLNNVQSVLAFDWVSGSDDLVFNGVDVANSEVTSITIEDGNSGTLEYTSFTEQRDLETGAVQQVAVLLQKQNAILTKQPSTPQPSRLINPSSVAFTGFKSLSFSCDGANDSITVTQGGNSVTYPHANLDGSLVRGYEIPFNNVAYSNSITFNGTGSVDVLKID